MVTEMGVEGAMISPGYHFETVPNQDLFISRDKARAVFKNVLDPKRDIRFYNNPLYLDFLRGNREYQCTAWSNPTYTPMGWREPCYLLGDRHTSNMDDLMSEDLWERYGVGKDPRCAQLYDALRLRVGLHLRSDEGAPRTRLEWFAAARCEIRAWARGSRAGRGRCWLWLRRLGKR